MLYAEFRHCLLFRQPLQFSSSCGLRIGLQMICHKKLWRRRVLAGRMYRLMCSALALVEFVQMASDVAVGYPWHAACAGNRWATTLNTWSQYSLTKPIGVGSL